MVAVMASHSRWGKVVLSCCSNMGMWVFSLKVMSIMLRRVKIKKLFLVLGVVGLAYLLLTMLLQNSLAVLFATLLGCTVGVILDDK